MLADRTCDTRPVGVCACLILQINVTNKQYDTMCGKRNCLKSKVYTTLSILFLSGGLGRSPELALHVTRAARPRARMQKNTRNYMN